MYNSKALLFASHFMAFLYAVKRRNSHVRNDKKVNFVGLHTFKWNKINFTAGQA